MNLTEIRAAMFAQADWSPEQSEEAVGRINGFINLQPVLWVFYNDRLH